MHRSIVCATFFASLSLCGLRESQAQMVRVGPGFVRAPYASVDWFPNGASHVRAPFVNVYSPGFFWGPGPWGPGGDVQRQVPDCAQMSWRELSETIWKWSGQLELDLEEMPGGDAWKDRLQAAEIAALVPQGQDAPPSDTNREQLQQILAEQQEATDSIRAVRIARLPSLARLQAALAEYVIPADERARRQLYAAADSLNRSLRRFKTGAGWQEYFNLAPGMTLSSDQDVAAEPNANSADLTQLLSRFESVQKNEAYRVISRIPEFETTRVRLAAFLNQPVAQSDTPEELPAPQPANVP